MIFLSDLLFSEGDRTLVVFSLSTQAQFKEEITPTDPPPPNFWASHLSLPLFQSSITSSTISPHSRPPPSSPQPFAHLVTLFTECIQEAISPAIIPTNQDRKLVPFWDKQLDDLRKKIPRRRPNFKRFHLSFRSCFRVKRRWYSSLGESINPSNAWSVIRGITGRKKKMAKPYPSPSVETSYTETAAQLTSHLASISNDPLISRAPADELFAMDPPDPNPSSFDSISEKITDEIIERAIFKPSTGSSAGADGSHCLPLSRHPPSPSALFHRPGSTLLRIHCPSPVLPTLAPSLF